MTDLITAARQAREALRPFSEAWEVATAHDAVVSHTTMAQLGSLAAREVSGVHFRNALEALAALDAAMESRAGGVWQPIETAPHGVEVLLATPPFASMGEQARWELKVGRASWGECIGGISNVSHDGWATHWMPLPTHPDTTLEDRT